MKNKMNKTIQKIMFSMIICFTTLFSIIPNIHAEAKPSYIIATDTTFAPFEFQDANGEYVGIDMDLLKAIAEDQGFEYELRPFGFNAALQALEAGQVDAVIAGMNITPERQQVFDFSDPYFSSGVQFAVLDRVT